MNWQFLELWISFDLKSLHHFTQKITTHQIFSSWPCLLLIVVITILLLAMIQIIITKIIVVLCWSIVVIVIKSVKFFFTVIIPFSILHFGLNWIQNHFSDEIIDYSNNLLNIFNLTTT